MLIMLILICLFWKMHANLALSCDDMGHRPTLLIKKRIKISKLNIILTVET